MLCTPRHRMPCNSRNEGSERVFVFMTWRVTSAVAEVQQQHQHGGLYEATPKWLLRSDRSASYGRCQALRSGSGGVTSSAADRRADRMKALKLRMNRDKRSTVVGRCSLTLSNPR